MRVFVALLVGIVLGAAGLWLYSSRSGRDTAQSAGTQIRSAAKTARDTVDEKIDALNLRPGEIKQELAHSGQVVRRKAKEAGQAIADATADARTTAAIKGKLLTHRDLSGLSISVNTTAGVVTLSGSVSSPEEISKAMLLAMEAEGVREVISTMQIKRAAARK